MGFLGVLLRALRTGIYGGAGAQVARFLLLLLPCVCVCKCVYVCVGWTLPGVMLHSLHGKAAGAAGAAQVSHFCYLFMTCERVCVCVGPYLVRFFAVLTGMLLVLLDKSVLCRYAG